MPIHECRDLRDRVHVFRDRIHAGEKLATLLIEFRRGDATVLGIPAGGVPVAAAVAGALELPLDVVVVSKITLPWNTEVGYGAVAFDGTTQLNRALVDQAGLGAAEIQRGAAETREKVSRRVAAMRGEEPAPDLAGRCIILVDDGLASGFTMQTAAEALRKSGAHRLVVAVPTASLRTAQRLATDADELYCANLRGGSRFAVADAYEAWSDVGEREAREVLERHQREFAARR